MRALPAAWLAGAAALQLLPAVKCLECRGACCESLVLRAENGEQGAWLRVFAARPLPDAEVEFEVRCSRLAACGRCGIYDERPAICRDFAPGGAACLDVVRRRRTPEQYQLIRDEADPERL